MLLKQHCSITLATFDSAIFHPIKLPFDAEAAEKFLKVI